MSSTPAYRPGRSRRWVLVTWGAVLTIGGPLGMAALAGALTDDWGGDDWGALGISVWLGILLFVIAWYLGRDAEHRGKAVANAELITSIGFLDTSAARSFAGRDHQALRISADARAALQQFTLADPQEQQALIASIQDAYSNLAFGTFARADSLARAVWGKLSGGAVLVVQEALAVAAKTRGEEQRRDLTKLAAHVAFVRRVGDAVRQGSPLSAPAGPAGPGHELGSIWTATEEDRKLGIGDVAPLEAIDQLALLYQEELTVWKDWAILCAASDRVSVSATVYEDLAPLRAWLAPWYVEWDEPGHRYLPVSMDGTPLDEAAANDVVAGDVSLPVHPEALPHGRVPTGLRSRGIANLRRLVVQQQPTTVCVLAYRLADPDSRTIVLDGNHRLAAAFHVHQEAVQDQERSPDLPMPVRVLAFTIAERRPVVTEVEPVEANGGATWRGFTPDIDLIRGRDSSPRGTPSRPHDTPS